MDRSQISSLLAAVAAGETSVEGALASIAIDPFASVTGETGHPEARVDHHRALLAEIEVLLNPRIDLLAAAGRSQGSLKVGGRAG